MKTKTLVGRIFTLTNHKRMYYDCDTWQSTQNMYKLIGPYVNKEKIGDSVMIYDESTKKVKIGIKSGHLIWISKAFLKQGVEQTIDSPKGELQTVIDELTDVVIKSNEEHTKKNINKLLVKIRSVLSYVEKL